MRGPMLLIHRVADDIRVFWCLWHAKRLRRREVHLTQWFNAIDDKAFREAMRGYIAETYRITIRDVVVEVAPE